MLNRSLEPEYEAVAYRDRHPDLHGMTPDEAIQHWGDHGRAEGRLAADLSLRENFLRFVSEEASILEIGPFGSPVVSGPNVAYFDVLDRNDLQARAAAIGLPTDRVPIIDWVSPQGDLSIVDRRFDAVVSSHCIEHQPDLIRHINAVSGLLRSGGRYYLLIPDKRYCFDALIPESEVSSVLNARGRAVHRLQSVIEHRAFTVHNDTGRHWIGDHVDDTHWTTVLPRLKAALAEFDGAAGGYVDVHAWQFTPDSFRVVVSTLHEQGLTRLGVERVYQTVFNRNEFTAVLQKATEDRSERVALEPSTFP